MARKPPKTNAMRQLDAAGIPYTPHSYSTADGALDGISVAHKTGQPPEKVFKTLVLEGTSGQLYVFCIPVECELPLKAAAKAAGEKSLAMLPHAKLHATTGYHKGGCSPIGMKRRYPTFIHHNATALPTVIVSGGAVGLQIELAPKNLLQATGATWFTPTP